jgi:hypothetical protein
LLYKIRKNKNINKILCETFSCSRVSQSDGRHEEDLLGLLASPSTPRRLGKFSQFFWHSSMIFSYISFAKR